MSEEEKEVNELNTGEPEEAAGGVEYYIVQPSGNLTRIANMYGTTWQRLQECNQIPNENLIYPGQHIIICY